MTFLVAAVFVALVVAGCGSNQAKTTNPTVQSTIGIIDMQKAIKAHPRYGDVQRLQTEHASLAARLEAEREQSVSAPGPSPAGAGGLEQATAKEFEARMAAKETEVRSQLDAAAAKLSQDLAAELDAYARELDKEYQPQLFNLQLKLKTVKVSSEEAAAIQAEVDKLQKERGAKLTARQQELVSKMDPLMQAKKREAEQEMEAYARTVSAELSGRLASQQADSAGRLTPPTAGTNDAAEKLAAASRDISALQTFIISDIRDKAAKVAAEKSLDTVLADVKLNFGAVDITAAVIAEFKK